MKVIRRWCPLSTSRPAHLGPRPAGQAVGTGSAQGRQGLHLGTSPWRAPAGHLQTHQGRAPPARRVWTWTPMHWHGYVKDGQETHEFPHLLPVTRRRLGRPRCASPSSSTVSAPILATKTAGRLGDWAAANNVELAYVPTQRFLLVPTHRVPFPCGHRCYFALGGTDHRSHDEQNSMIRRYIAGRNRHKDNEALRAISLRGKSCPTWH